MLERLGQTLTEVWLKRIEVYRVESPTELGKRYYVQISRKENWNGLLKKMNRIWGSERKGVIAKCHSNNKTVVEIANFNQSFEE